MRKIYHHDFKYSLKVFSVALTVGCFAMNPAKTFAIHTAANISAITGNVRNPMAASATASAASANASNDSVSGVPANNSTNTPTKLAKQKTITGTILDEDGNPLPGAGITVKGGSGSVITDTNGTFTISVPDDNAVLVVKYIGYETQEILVGTKTRLEVKLVASASSLSQVVVVGYGSQRKSDVTGSVK